MLSCVIRERRVSNYYLVKALHMAHSGDCALLPEKQTPYGPADINLAEQSCLKNARRICRPFYERLLVKRSGRDLHNWRKLSGVPYYFKNVERPPGSVPNPSGVINNGLQKFVGTFEKTRLNYTKMMRFCATYYNDKNTLWLPVGINQGRLPVKAARALETAATKGPGIAFYENYAEWMHMRGDCNDNAGRLLDPGYLMKQVFKLDNQAIQRIESKTSSMLKEVNIKCALLKKTRKTGTASKREKGGPSAVRTVFIKEEEYMFEVKIGVYFVPSTGKVYKFLVNAANYPEFFTETSIGLCVEGVVVGACGVNAVCPEHFVIEMDYCGPSLGTVLYASTERQPNEKYIYNAIMMQSTAVKISVRASNLIDHIFDGKIRDSYRAALLMEYIRKRMIINNLPFFLSEIVNIVTRFGRQRLINLDLKSDNFTVDWISGSPKMIDLNLVLPVGFSDLNRTEEDITDKTFVDFPQTPPEYLKGETCYESSMSYGLAYLLRDVLYALKETGDHACISLYVNMRLSEWISRAYSESARNRPSPYGAAVLIGSAFPFPKNIKDMFICTK